MIRSLLKAIPFVLLSSIVLILWTALRIIKVIGDIGTSWSMAGAIKLAEYAGIKPNIEEA